MFESYLKDSIHYTSQSHTLVVTPLSLSADFEKWISLLQMMHTLAVSQDRQCTERRTDCGYIDYDVRCKKL